VLGVKKVYTEHDDTCVLKVPDGEQHDDTRKIERPDRQQHQVYEEMTIDSEYEEPSRNHQTYRHPTVVQYNTMGLPELRHPGGQRILQNVSNNNIFTPHSYLMNRERCIVDVRGKHVFRLNFSDTPRSGKC
jgi:hypothetical protein